MKRKNKRVVRTDDAMEFPETAEERPHREDNSSVDDGESREKKGNFAVHSESTDDPTVQTKKRVRPEIKPQPKKKSMKTKKSNQVASQEKADYDADSESESLPHYRKKEESIKRNYNNSQKQQSNENFQRKKIKTSTPMSSGDADTRLDMSFNGY